MGRNPEHNQKVRDDRREQILSASLRLFAARGLAATKITDIAATAGISQGLVYHYFESKEDIFTALITGVLERLTTAAHGLETLAISPRDKIKLALGGLLKNLEENEDAARAHLLIAQATASNAIPAATRQVIERENQKPYVVIARIMRAGQEDGDIVAHDADQLAVLFWTTIKGLAIHRAVHGEGFKAPPVELVMKLFLSGHCSSRIQPA